MKVNAWKSTDHGLRGVGVAHYIALDQDMLRSYLHERTSCCAKLADDRKEGRKDGRTDGRPFPNSS